MSELDISEQEAEYLLHLPKIAETTEPVELPDLGGRTDIPLVSDDGREQFVVSFTRSSISLAKRNHHLRARKVIGLARLDLDGPPHRNPDGQEVGPRHLHIYREGYGLKFAIEVPVDKFGDLDNALRTLDDFLTYCGVKKPPEFSRGLFSK
ncbi:MAG: DUF6978 family protein [Rhizobium rhizophilum]|uniref:DUF6978 family protein n=1 Tax=Rhizobium rhizophilum TaxID=1850373 RepID=UPI00391B275A